MNFGKRNTKELSIAFDRMPADQIASMAPRAEENIVNVSQDLALADFSRFTSLDKEGRTHVDTATAAHHLGRKPQTLRVWATYETGPIRPIRVYGRLAWPVAEIRRLLTASA